MANNAPIDDALNLTPYQQETEENVPAIPQDTSLDANQTADFEDARDNLHNVLTKSSAAMDDLLAYAQQAQHPRAYEVLNQMMRTVADISGALTDLHLKAAKLEVEKAKTGTSINNRTVNNNMFIGTTADIQKMLAKAVSETPDDIIDVEPTNE